MLQGLTGVHLVVIVFLVVLLFGAPKLPELAKNLGQSMRILKKEVSDSADGSAADTPRNAAGTDTGGSSQQ